MDMSSESLQLYRKESMELNIQHRHVTSKEYFVIRACLIWERKYWNKRIQEQPITILLGSAAWGGA